MIHDFYRDKISLICENFKFIGFFWGVRTNHRELCVYDIDKITWFWWDYEKLWINTISSWHLVWKSAINDNLLFDVNVVAIASEYFFKLGAKEAISRYDIATLCNCVLQ
jgi:hypothetical protein